MKPTRMGIDRRRFLKLTAAASGLAIGGCAPSTEYRESATNTEMRYRPLGDTGLQISEISVGARGLTNPGLLVAALDTGINCVTTSAPYLDGRDEEAIGKAISRAGISRDRLILLTGDYVRAGSTTQMVLDSIDGSLRRLGTDHVEIFCALQVGSAADLRIDALFEAFERARQAGKVLQLAFSGHSGGMQNCMNAAIDDGRFKAFFIKYDFASYPDQDQILERAAQQGISALVFKTNAGNRQQEIRDLEAAGYSFTQATIKWALANPHVTSVCVSLENFEQIREYIGAVGSPLVGKEAEMLRRYAGEMYDRYCRFCGSCEASCPRGVAIADVNRFAMYFKYYGREKVAMQQYADLASANRAGQCAGCSGHCDAECPFQRSVRDELVEAHHLLSFSQA